eukprot:6480628-Amphidinium_carterae.1
MLGLYDAGSKCLCVGVCLILLCSSSSCSWVCWLSQQAFIQTAWVTQATSSPCKERHEHLCVAREEKRAVQYSLEL